jgi:small nuclear ribonucleoprotein
MRLEEQEESPEIMTTKEVEKLLNEVVTVSAKDGRKFKGKLTQYDEYMNLLLEDAEEQLAEGKTKKLGLVLLKGGNISAVSI